MAGPIRFVVNERPVDCGEWEGAPLLDYLRRGLGMTGTKEGCREGDCGACAVILGERVAVGEFAAGGERAGSAGFRFRAQPSCLMTVGELEGKLLLTIEGISAAGAERGVEGLSPVQRAFLDENASQCGFCTPGFVVSLTAWLLEGPEALSEEGAMRAIEGNLCRCTGYGSIRRAASRLIASFKGLPAEPLARLSALVEAGAVPASLLDFAKGGLPGAAPTRAAGEFAGSAAPVIVAGGTDLYVREPHPEPRPVLLLRRRPELAFARLEGGSLLVGAALPIRDFFESPAVRAAIPGVEAHEGAFASILVRNRATVGGNVCNASPVGDLTSILMALGAVVRITRLPAGGGELPEPRRELPLEAFYLGYKKLALEAGELVHSFALPAPAAGDGLRFAFEKASKRETLDIAAVNVGLRFELEGGRLARVRVSAGGVAATPLLLSRAPKALEGAPAGDPEALHAAVRAALAAAMAEVSPIGDVRGSADYRRRVLGRLLLAALARCLPGLDAARIVAEEARP